jgi:hypothetical protein
MPATWRVHVLRARLAAEGIDATVIERDLYSLEGGERATVLDAMIRDGADPPMVLVDGVLACAGDLDVDATVVAARAWSDAS